MIRYEVIDITLSAQIAPCPDVAVENLSRKCGPYLD